MAKEKAVLNGQRVQSGTFGECWFDGEYLSEVKGINIKDEFNKEEIPRVGVMRADTKVTAINGKGSLTLYKINSMAIKVLRNFVNNGGEEPRFTIMTRQADPSGLGVEQTVYKGVSFDDLTWINTEVNKITEIEMPFTYAEVESIEVI